MKNKKTKNQFNFILFFLLISISYMYKQTIVYSCAHKNQITTSKREFEKLIDEGSLNGKKEDLAQLFVGSFNRFLKSDEAIGFEINLTGNKQNETRTIVTIGKGLEEDDYKVFFEQKHKNEITSRQQNIETALVNSICGYYSISKADLKKIRQNKIICNRSKKEINAVFSKCLWLIDQKFIKDSKTTVINEDKLAELVAEKLIQKQNEPLAPDAQIPTVPTLL